MDSWEWEMSFEKKPKAGTVNKPVKNPFCKDPNGKKAEPLKPIYMKESVDDNKRH